MSAESTLELLREIIFKLAPSLVLAGVHRYTVEAGAGDGRYNLAPAPKVLHGPRLRVEQMAAPGIEAGLAVGDELAIVFLDNDERYPAIIAHAPLRRSTPTSLRVDCSGTLRLGASASLVHLGNGTERLAIGLEVLGRRVVCYGDNLQIPVVGALAVGLVIQNAATAPNEIAKVRT